MKMVKSLFLGIIAISLISSCKKEGNGASAEDIAKANDFKAYISGKQFQISEYYSDKAIDYITTDDTVKSETDLWPYVSRWIKDDLNSFNSATGKVTIEQGAVKMDGLTADELTYDFSIGADKSGPYFNFLNYQYKPLKYQLVEFTNSYFLVYVNWTGGSKVFTKFSVIQ